MASTAHLPTPARFRARAPGPVSGRLSAAPGRGAGHAAAFSRCLSATGIGFLGILSRPGIPPPLTAGLPRRQRGADPDRVSMFRTRETRPAQGALCTPGAAVSTRPVDLPGRRLPHRSGQPLSPRDHNPPRGVSVTRHQQGFTAIHPTPAFPSPATPGGTGSLAFTLSFAPGRAGPGNARQGGDRPRHWPGLRPWHQPASFAVLTHHVRPHVARPTRSVRPPVSPNSILRPRRLVLAAGGEDITRSSDVPRRPAQPGSIRPPSGRR